MLSKTERLRWATKFHAYVAASSKVSLWLTPDDPVDLCEIALQDQASTIHDYSLLHYYNYPFSTATCHHFCRNTSCKVAWNLLASRSPTIRHTWLIMNLCAKQNHSQRALLTADPAPVKAEATGPYILASTKEHKVHSLFCFFKHQQRHSNTWTAISPA